MTRILPALLLLLSTAAAGQDFYVADAPLGDDTQDCLTVLTPCLTMQAASDKIPKGGVGSVNVVGCGTFAPLSVFYYKFVGVFGSQADFSCVKILAPAGGTAVTCQDKSMVMLQHLSLISAGSGSTGFLGRGDCIGDIAFVRYGAFAGGNHNVFTVGSTLNCIGNIYVDGAAESFVNLDNAKGAYLGCLTTLQAVHFNNAFIVGKDSNVRMNGATFANPGVTGKQWSLMNTVMERPAVGAVPGHMPGTTDSPWLMR